MVVPMPLPSHWCGQLIIKCCMSFSRNLVRTPSKSTVKHFGNLSAHAHAPIHRFCPEFLLTNFLFFSLFKLSLNFFCCWSMSFCFIFSHMRPLPILLLIHGMNRKQIEKFWKQNIRKRKQKTGNRRNFFVVPLTAMSAWSSPGVLHPESMLSF